jgi:hypothetical protein
MSKWADLRGKLGIQQQAHDLTLAPREKYFNKVKDNIPLIDGYNYMADLLFLPTTRERYKYLLVIVDLATDEFDIEPLRDKESKSVLNAMLTIFNDRDYLEPPYASMRTDKGTEFMGEFTKWLYEHDILHKRGLVGRHTQQANVERLNRTLGELLMGYMNSVEMRRGYRYHEWTDILPALREELNNIRRKPTPHNINTYKYPVWDAKGVAPKYKKGDLVFVKLTEPRDALGYKQIGTKAFRAGDIRWSKFPKKINQVLYYTGRVPYRYMVNGYPQVSYTEAQLRPATGHTEELFEIKKIIGDRMRKGKQEYHVVFDDGDKSWLSEDYLQQVAPLLVDFYERERKK